MAINWNTHVRNLHVDPASGPQGEIPLCTPNCAATIETTYTSAGQLYYDETNTRLRAYINGAWATLATSTTSSTMDDTYNNGSTITVDTGDVALNLSTGTNLIVNAAAAGTTAVGLEINDNTTGTITDGILFTAANSIVDAIDASAANITNAINVGANVILGTTGNITFTNFSFTGSSGALACQSIDRASAGGLTIGGSTATSLTLTPNTTASGTLGVTGLLTLSAGITQSGGNMSFTVSATTGNGFAIDGSTVSTGNVLAIEYDAATAGAGFGAIEITEDGSAVWTVAEDGNMTIAGTASGTDAITITAGDITLTSGDLTLTNGNLVITAGLLDITGDAGADTIDITGVAGGAVFDIDIPNAANLATGYIDIDTAGTGSGPILAVVHASTYTGSIISIDQTNAVGSSAIALTGAGVRTVAMVSITDTPSTVATFDLNVTPANAAADANVFDIDIAGSGDANIIDIAFATTYTAPNGALYINTTNAVGTSAIGLLGAGVRTVPLFAITDVPTTSAPTFDINITPGAAVQAGFDIDVAGTTGADIIAIDFSAAHTGDALNITMTNCGAGAQAIVVDGSLAASGAMVSLSSSGIFTAAGSVLTCAASTQPGAANTGTCGRFLDTGAAQATTYAVQIDSTNNEALTVTTGRAHFVESISSLASNACGIAENYVQAGGVANAITVAAITDASGTTIPLVDGLRLTIDLGAQTLQAGANTLNYAAGGAVSITRATSTAANLGTAFAANGVIEVIYSSGATAWLCLSQ